jgi:hypothetical protein
MSNRVELPARAITLRPWWAWAVAHAGKRIENRSWSTRYRGPIAIHAGCARLTPSERRVFAQKLTDAGVDYPDESSMVRGAIVAVAQLLDCAHPLSDPLDPWGESGFWQWQLGEVRALERPVPMTGKLGIWHIGSLGAPQNPSGCPPSLLIGVAPPKKPT